MIGTIVVGEEADGAPVDVPAPVEPLVPDSAIGLLGVLGLFLAAIVMLTYAFLKYGGDLLERRE